MNNTNKYAEDLRRKNGLDRALKIAKGRMDHTAPSTWSALPKSVVFYSKDRHGNAVLPEKKLMSLHNWWTQVFHILCKYEC